MCLLSLGGVGVNVLVCYICIRGAGDWSSGLGACCFYSFLLSKMMCMRNLTHIVRRLPLVCGLCWWGF